MSTRWRGGHAPHVERQPRRSGIRWGEAHLLRVTAIQMPLKLQPYGDWEFEVRDPNGYVLVFGGAY